MVHQFDDRTFAHCLQQQQQQPRHHAQHRQPLTAAHQYCTAGPTTSSRSTGVDYVMYCAESGNATGCGDIAARSPTSACHHHHHAGSCVTNAVTPTNQQHLHHPSSLLQQHYFMDYHRHHLGSKSARLGPGEDPMTTWAYPSVTGDAEASPAGWSTTIGRSYSSYLPTDDSLDLLHHQLLNQDRTSLSDSDYIYQTPSCDNSATAAVTVATGPTSRYHLQPEPEAVGAVSVVKQHLIDIESRAQHLQPAESVWTQSEHASFDWMKKQTFSPLTPTGTHSRCFDHLYSP